MYWKAKCSKHEDKITEQNVMIKDLTQLNMELQRDIIEYFGEFKGKRGLVLLQFTSLTICEFVYL